MVSWILQLLHLIIESVIALLEFANGDRTYNTHFQKAIFFSMDGRQARLQPQGAPLVHVVFHIESLKIDGATL
mgnify:CR=1